jgi:hypothetical protein
VQASNIAGISKESVPVAVSAETDKTVTFLDDNDNLISTQTVKYGEAAKTPTKPEKEHHDFYGWSDNSIFTSVTADVTVKAIFTAKRYTVTFFDTDEKTQLKREYVTFPNAATPPDNYTIKPENVFAGWHVTYDSTGTDYMRVDGDMKLIATQTWGNKDLPVFLTIKSAERKENGKEYAVVVNVKNNPTEQTSGRLIATLKTAEDKTVRSQTSEFVLNGNQNTDTTITIAYSNAATVFEVAAVGFDADNAVKTGGAISKSVKSPITQITDFTWGDWDEWSTTRPASYSVNDDRFEAKTQYRARNKETKTVSTNTAPDVGWALEKTISTVGKEQGPSTTNPGAKTGRTIRTVTTPATYKTQYVFSGYKGSNGVYHFCSTQAKKYYPGVTWTPITITLDSDIARTALSPAQSCSCHGTFSSVYWKDGKGYFTRTTKSVEKTPASTKYYWTDTTYTYQFYRWLDWSDWSETPVSGDEAVSQTLYRSREKLPVSADAGKEDTSGEIYSVSGKLKGIDDDNRFDGELATIMVYKKTNSDPTEEQLEYVGQTEIGAGNTYDFSFKTREAPSDDPLTATGDFIVSLGLEGADKLVNVDVIKVPEHEYEVTFDTGNELVVQTVKKGETAIPPEVPVVKGKTFTDWDETPTNITQKMTIPAVYKNNTQTVVFAQADDGNPHIDKLEYNSTLAVPEAPVEEGMVFTGWLAEVGGQTVAIKDGQTVTDNMLLTASWEPETFEVSFLDENGETIPGSTQMVEYGEPAVPPDDLSVPGLVFDGWDANSEWWNVKGNLVVSPVLRYETTTEAPVYSLYEDEESKVLVLTSSTEGARIYYTMDGTDPIEAVGEQETDESEPVDSEPTGEDEPYIGEPDYSVIAIEITENMIIKAFAIAEGSNKSETITINIGYNSKLISSMSIKSHPRNMSYNEGQTLDLTGLVVTLASDEDGYSADIGYEDFAANGIMVNYTDGSIAAHGDVLTAADHDGKTLTLTCGGESVQTRMLTVRAPEDFETPYYIITAYTDKGGMVSGGGIYDENASVTLTATPNPGYIFGGWYENNIQISTDLAYMFTALANRIIEARFTAVSITLSKSYLIMQIGESGGLEVTTTVPIGVNWQSSDGTVARVDSTGFVTAVGVGTAIIKAYNNELGLYAECRIDVTEEPASNAVKGVNLIENTVTSNVYSTNYAKIPLQLVLEQNMPVQKSVQSSTIAGYSMRSASEVISSNIESVRLIDDTNKYFTLQIVDDRNVLLIPNANVKTASISSLKTKVEVIVDGQAFTTADTLTIKIAKSKPTLRATAIKFNSFFPDEPKPITVTTTIGKVEIVSLANTRDYDKVNFDPAHKTISLKNKDSKPKKLTLNVKVDEFGETFEVPLTVSASLVKPVVKLNASSVTMNQSAELVVSGPNISNIEVDANEDFSATKPDANGKFTLRYMTGGNVAANISLKLKVSFNNTDQTILLPFTVKKPGKSAVKLSKSTVTLNQRLVGDKAAITVTTTPVDVDMPSITGDTDKVSVNIIGKTIELSLTEQAVAGKTYKLKVGTANLNVKVVFKAPLIKLGAKGALDIVNPDSMMTLTPNFTNFNYTGGDVAVSNDYFEIVEVNSSGAVTLRISGEAEKSTIKQSVSLVYADAGGHLWNSNPINITPKQGKITLTQSTKQIKLQSNDIYSEGWVDISVSNPSTVQISDVKLGSAFANLYAIRRVQHGNYAIGFKDNIACDVGKGANVKLDVYFEGLSTPTTLTVKVAVS